MITTPTVEVFSTEALIEHISKTTIHHEDALREISAKIHANPELSYQEFQAHDNICSLLEGIGYTVQRHAYSLETAFQVEYGSGGKLVVFNAEYDALPRLGHACGHNLIAASSIAAFLATAKALQDSGIEGRVRLLGTPAEEGGGGKVLLLRAGAYKGVDACLMGHPTGCIPAERGSHLEGVSAWKCLAFRTLKVNFTGKSSHAATFASDGHNALDAVVSSYVNISLLRQQIPSIARIHAVIRDGGANPNIIPDFASMEYFVRDGTVKSAMDLSKKVEACFHAGAMAAGCTVDCDWNPNSDYKDLVPNKVVSRELTKYMQSFGRTYLESTFEERMPASTDMGNVTYEVPGLHCAFSIGTTVPAIQPHTPEFKTAAGTQEALLRALDCGKGLAATAYSLLANPDLLQEAWTEFDKEVRPNRECE